MKRFFLLCFVLSLFVVPVSAEENGQWALGPRMNIYTNTGDRAIIGLGAFARFNLTEGLRMEPMVVALFDEGSSIDAGVDLHYLFQVADRWHIYPVVGVTVSDIDKWALGMNVGGGVDFRIAQSWDLSAGVKWMPVFDSARKNPVVISVGGAYRF